MSTERMDIVILGLSITSSWGNGHATTYRGLVRALAARGHRLLFLERDVPWYAQNRDLPRPPYGKTRLYNSLQNLSYGFAPAVRAADLVILGSYVPDGRAVAEWVLGTARGVRAFYDIDTPVTVAALERGDCEYLTSSLAARFDLYLSFTGGPMLRRIEQRIGAPMARPLYCSVDPDVHYPIPGKRTWELGYMGTYSKDRQPGLERLLCEPARRMPEDRFTVAGPLYPAAVRWPANVERMEHVPPTDHRDFYNRQRFTLNLTRADMVAAGWSPSVRLFEAAACGTPIISDEWPGLDELLEPEAEVLIARDTSDVLSFLRELTPDEARRIGRRARQRILRDHTAAQRAQELEAHVAEQRARARRQSRSLSAQAAGAG